MRFIVSILFAAFLTGCAAPVYKVTLDSPETNGLKDKVTVVDNRLDQQVYITGLSIAGTNIYTYKVKPTLSNVLDSMIQLNLKDEVLQAKIAVFIEGLDLKNQVGFGTADKLSCIIESRIVMESGDEKIIKTLSRNNESISPFIKTMGKLIVDQCLEEHARDISQFINKSS